MSVFFPASRERRVSVCLGNLKFKRHAFNGIDYKNPFGGASSGAR
jgi:hypothetical protein